MTRRSPPQCATAAAQAREAVCGDVPRHARRRRRSRLGDRHGGSTRAIPAYAMPEDAVRALAAATRYGEWRAKDHGTPVAPAGHRTAASPSGSSTGCSRSTPGGAASRTRRPRALLRPTASSVWGNELVAHGRRGGRGRRAGGLPRGAQVDVADGAAPGRGRGSAGRPAQRGVAASRVGVAHGAARAARRRPPRRAADGHPRCAVRDHVRRGPAVRPGHRVQRGRDADRAARRHRLPHPAAHGRRRSPS